MMRQKELIMINIAIRSGILVILVTKPSRKPAIMKKGMVLTTIFKPLFTPLVKDLNLE